MGIKCTNSTVCIVLYQFRIHQSCQCLMLLLGGEIIKIIFIPITISKTSQFQSLFIYPKQKIVGDIFLPEDEDGFFSKPKYSIEVTSVPPKSWLA